MFYLLSGRTTQKPMPQDLDLSDSRTRVILADVHVRQIGEENLLLCPATGAWCFLTNTEMETCHRLANTSLDELQEETSLSSSRLLRLLEHLYVRGLLAVSRGGTIQQANWDAVRLEAPSTFILTLLLASHCNLACKYCYLDSASIGKRPLLSRELAQRAVEYALGQLADQVSIDFGEVATSHALFRDLIHETQRLSDLHAKEVSLAIHTNGTTLDSGLVDLLVQYDVLAGFSLDGPAHLHDQVRVFPNGKATHERTVQALREVLRRNIPHVVTCTISQANYLCAREILDHFFHLGIVHYYFKPVIRRGAAQTWWTEVGIQPEEYCHFIDDLLDSVTGSGNLDRLDESLLRCLFRALGDSRGWSSRCSSGYCNCGHDILVIDSQGGLYPCPRFATVDLGEFYLGTEALESCGYHVLDELATRFDSLPDACEACPWRSLCHGGCALSAWYFGGHPGAMDPECLVHKHIYNSVFERLIPMLRHSDCVSSKLGRIEVVDERIL